MFLYHIFCVCETETSLCELLSLVQQAVEDGAEVTQQSLAVLKKLQSLRISKIRRAVK